MVAAQIGEARRLNLHAVEAILVEAVARCFHRAVIDTGIGDLSQQLVQIFRCRGGQCLGFRESVSAQAERAEAAAFVSEQAEQLLGEQRG